MLRQVAGLTTLKKYFDQLDESQRRCSDIIIQMIQKFWSYGKIKQVIGEEPTPEFDDKAFFTYGARIVQGVLTDTQQQLELSQLFELQQRFGEIFPPDEIIEAMTIQNKDRIIEKMQAAQKQQQEQAQQQAQQQIQQMQVDMQATMADAQSKQALGQERIAKISTDMAIAEDKLKRAHTEDTASLLNLIKAIKELEGIDLDHMLKNLSILEAVQPETTISPTVAAPQESIV